ncbi:MAG: Gfo/Idh/MocA family oxidoreductase, partial [Bacteroidia bacterium]
GLTLAVAYQRRTAPDNQAIKTLIEQGALGNIFAADLSAKFYRDQAYYDSAEYRGGYTIDGGGPFIQQACHNIDIYTWFFGLPKTVKSMMDTFTHRMEAEDHGAALLRHPNGMIGTIVASTATKPGFAARLEVHSDKGSFTMTDDRITDWQMEGVPNPANSSFHYQHDGATSASVSDASAHTGILRDFEEAVESGREPLVSGPSAKETSDLILEIYRAAAG